MEVGGVQVELVLSKNGRNFFILFLGIFILFFSLVSAVTIESGVILKTNSSGAEITFSSNVSVTSLEIGSNFIYLEGISYTRNGASYSCDLNYTGTSIIDSSSFCVSSSGENSNTGSSSAGFPLFVPSQNDLEKGYTKTMRENWKIQFKFNNGTKQVEVTSVNKTLNSVSVNVNGSDYAVNENETKKIDFNDDGYYDLSIKVNSIDNYNNANMTFTEIHEEIQPSTENQQTGNTVQDSGVSGKIINFGDWKIYVLLGIIVVLVILNVFKKRR